MSNFRPSLFVKGVVYIIIEKRGSEIHVDSYYVLDTLLHHLHTLELEDAPNYKVYRTDSNMNLTEMKRVWVGSECPSDTPDYLCYELVQA